MDKGFHHKMIPWLDKEAYIIAIYICALFFPILSVATLSVEVC